jgi:hypothetical protein
MNDEGKDQDGVVFGIATRSHSHVENARHSIGKIEKQTRRKRKLELEEGRRMAKLEVLESEITHECSSSRTQTPEPSDDFDDDDDDVNDANGKDEADETDKKDARYEKRAAKRVMQAALAADLQACHECSSSRTQTPEPSDDFDDDDDDVNDVNDKDEADDTDKKDARYEKRAAKRVMQAALAADLQAGHECSSSRTQTPEPSDDFDDDDEADDTDKKAVRYEKAGGQGCREGG